MARKRNGNANSNGTNGVSEIMAKLSKAQNETLSSFFETVGWGDDDATELSKLNESMEKAKQAVKALEAEISGFGNRKDKAAELLSWFDSGPLGATASADDRVSFLCSSLKVRPKRAAAAAGDGPTYKATDEEKESVMESLDGEGKTVGEIAKETGLETKEVSRICKSLLADGMARKEGERRGTRYFLVSEALDDAADETEE